jgi:energy-coupling factor transporter ATP-binding protein EcfA2
MSKPKVFISYSHVDEKRWKNRLQKHLKVLERHGSLSFWDDRRIAVGQEWRAEIKAALDSADAAILLISTDFLGSNFINDNEVPAILERRIRDGMRVFPLIVRSCHWQKVPWLEPLQARPTDGKPLAQFRGDDVDRILTELVSEIDTLLNKPQPETSAATETRTSKAAGPADECPYLGLEAFTEDKEHLFFGRDDFADELFAKVKRQNFVALVGPSGCGKSSVVQAGLFSRLQTDAQKWEKIIFPPREDPFLSLAAGFVWRWQPQANYAVNTNEAKKLAAELKDAKRLIEAIHRTVATPDGRLLLVVDQFEELFTLCGESNRRAFLDILLAAKDVAPVTILLTLRADFMGQSQSFSPAFSQLLDESIISHRPLTHADLEAVITGPARYAGLEFEPGLVNLILQEVASHPDSLPLLEYALKEMWRKRQSRMMGHALYEAVGKVEGAISQHADAVLQTLPESEQQLALRALTRLVRVAGEEGEADTRLRLPLGELSEAERTVLQTFVTNRLLVTKRKEGPGAETIEVAHEALIRRWGKLREALDSDREFLMWRRRLDSRRKAWEQKGRNDKWLLYGGERDDAQRWLNERGAELISAEIDFITWDDRPDFQIGRILSESHNLFPFSDDEIRKNWLVTLVFCREKEKALSIMWEIEDSDYRLHALNSIAEALVRAGMVAEALAAACEIEDSYSRGEVLSSVAEATVKAGMAAEALTAAREIEDAYSRVQALSSVAEALVKAGMTAEALAAAREIEDAYSRVQALSSVAEALVKAGMTAEAREVMTEALAAAREIEDTDSRAIAEAVVKAGMAAEAREVTPEALAAARGIEDAFSRVWVLSLITEAMVKTGIAAEAREVMTEALAVAREIEDADSRMEALREIAEAMVKAGMVAEALATAREIEYLGSRAWALSSIAEEAVKAGMVAEALATARETENRHSRAQVLSTIAEALAKRGMEAEALAAAREIEDAYSRARALSSLAEEAVKAGMAAEALAAAREIENEYSRAQASSSIAKAMVKAGMEAEALAAAREIEPADLRRQVLSTIAEALVKAGMAAEALAAAREIENEYSRARALSTIAEALVKAGMVAEALAAAREVEDVESRAEVLSTIAEVAVKAGMVAEALATAREIENQCPRAQALIAVANFWLDQRRDDEASTILEEVRGAISKVFEDDDRSKLMRSLAIILARLHSYRAAREAAEQCSISEDRLDAYTSILREYYIERDPGLARLFAQEEKEED